MQAGDYDRTGVIPAARRVVFIDGVRVDDTWLLRTTMEAEISSDLPELVAGVGSTGAARFGTVEIGPRRDVDEVAPTPMNREGIWPPKRGMGVTIEDEQEGSRWRRATGVVVDVEANVGEQRVRISWRDGMDDLGANVELAPIAKSMPGYEQDVNGVLRRYWHRTGIEPWGIVCEAMEDAGYRILPSIPDVDFYCLFQGKAFPRIGRIRQTYSAGDLLSWDNESGFQYLNQWSYFEPGYEGRANGDCFTVYLRKTRGGPDAQTRWTMADGAEIRVTLQNGSVAVSRDGVVLAQRGFTGTSPLPWVGVSFAYTSTVLWVEGQDLYHVMHEPPLPTGALDWTRVRVLGAAALAVSYVPRAGWPGFNWPSLRFRGAGPGLVTGMNSSRSVENDRTVRNLIGEISSATLTGFWMDEHGTLNWIPSNILESGPVTETLTEMDDLISGSWEEVPDGVKRGITVTYDEVAIEAASDVGVAVGSEGGGRTLSAGDAPENFVGPDSDEEWIEPDMTPLPAGQNTPLMTTAARQSWWGGSYLFREGVDSDGNRDSDTDIYGWANLPYGEDYMTINVEPLTPRRWKVTHTVKAGAPQVQLVTLPNSSVLPPAWQSYTLPIWRARGRVAFTKVNISYQKGPSWAEDYTHDLEEWGTRADAQRIGNWLADRTREPMILLDQVQQVPDPRRQLGDVVDLDVRNTMGGFIRALITGINEVTGPGTWRQTVNYRLISTTPTAERTYAVVEAEHDTYADAEAAHTTYDDIEEG